MRCVRQPATSLADSPLSYIYRCLFWIYLLVMFFTTVGCLVIYPMTKEHIPPMPLKCNHDV